LWALGPFGDDFEHWGWHQTGGPRGGRCREGWTWRNNPVVRRAMPAVVRVWAWAVVVRAAVLGRPILSGVHITGGKLSAWDRVVVGADAHIQACETRAAFWMTGPRATLTDSMIQPPENPQVGPWVMIPRVGEWPRR
jgi:hypothetical protein